jgi:hypothetical protein
MSAGHVRASRLPVHVLLTKSTSDPSSPRRGIKISALFRPICMIIFLLFRKGLAFKEPGKSDEATHHVQPPSLPFLGRVSCLLGCTQFG